MLDHLDRLSDGGGIIQFSRFDIPDRSSGYCVDDVARLGIVAASLCDRRGAVGASARDWLGTSVRFLEEATTPTGMYNLRASSGQWLDEPHFGDHVGRAFWALGVIVGEQVPHQVQRKARALLERALPMATATPDLRASAYTALGLAQVLHPGVGEQGSAPIGTDAGDTLRTTLRTLADRLDSALGEGSATWRWFEPTLTYDNARLPEALIAAGNALGDHTMVQRGLESLEWYLGEVGLHTDLPQLRLVGNTWRSRADGADSALCDLDGDEQPLDAAAVVESLVGAWRVTRDPRYARLARRAFAWFDGANRAGIPLYDPASGGSRDGLAPGHANANMGAESTLAYYQALVSLVDSGLVALPEWPGRQGREHRTRGIRPRTQDTHAQRRATGT